MQNSIQNKRIVITGGAGFIGSNLCEYFLKKNNQIVCLDNFSTGFVIEILPYIKSKRMSLQLNTLCDIRRRFINIFLTKFLTNDFTFTSRDDVFLIRRK